TLMAGVTSIAGATRNFASGIERCAHCSNSVHSKHCRAESNRAVNHRVVATACTTARTSRTKLQAGEGNFGACPVSLGSIASEWILDDANSQLDVRAVEGLRS